MRQSLPEKKLAWCENLQPIGPNNIKTVPAPATPLHTINGKTITKQFYFNFGQSTDYVIDITSDGGGYATTNPGAVTTQFAPNGTFSPTPDMTQWGTSALLIADSVAGYCVWNGTVFVTKGGVDPLIIVTAGGSGYTSGATAAISGGSGSGATVTVTVVAGVVTAIVLTNPGSGYEAADTLTVTITAVGAGSGATATAFVWPFISPNPTTIAEFQGRVFLAQTNVITYTGTGGYDDFSSGDASGTFTINDPDLVHSITALRSLNNYLFVVGDNSIKQIGNLTVASSITSFTLVTLSSDQGTIFQNAICSFNRLMLFGNTVGVYAVFGSSVEKISDDMDGVFQSLDFTQNLVAAVNDINNIHVFLLLAKYIDPALGARSLIMAYMNKKWFVISQGNSLKYITTAIIDGTTNTFSTSGSDITKILSNPNTPVNITVKTALSPHGNPLQGKRALRYAVTQLISQSNTLKLTFESEIGNNAITYNTVSAVEWMNNSNQVIQWINNSSSAVNFYGSGFIYATGQCTVSGAYLGATLTGTVANFALNAIMLEYETSSLFPVGIPEVPA
jgi:hypothetical protein